MQFSAATIAAFVALSSDAVLALPAASENSLVKRITAPTSINCGLAGISAAGVQNTMDAATALTKAGGKCTTNAAAGTCIRVGCFNTSGIWMCNNDGHEGPFTADCATVSLYTFDPNGQADGKDGAFTGSPNIWQSCLNAVGAIDAASGQAWDYRGNWNVIAGYANCNISPDNGPSEQG